MRARKDRIYNDVEFLTSLRPFRNYRNLDSLEVVIKYIQKEFILAGGVAETQSWEVKGREYKNVILAYNASKSRRLILGAHYDVCGDQPGADDNASAVAGLLEVARLVFEAQPILDYRIDFVAFCLEEPPFFATEFMGSFIHAKSLAQQKADVMGMISLEMIGYFSNEPNSQAFPSPGLAKIYPHTANFIIVVGIERYKEFNSKVHREMIKEAQIDVQKIDFSGGAGLAGLSDQCSYWKFDFPALMINDTSFLRNPNYHLGSDTIETLDFDKMKEVINCTFRMVINMGGI